MKKPRLQSQSEARAQVGRQICVGTTGRWKFARFRLLRLQHLKRRSRSRVAQTSIGRSSLAQICLPTWARASDWDCNLGFFNEAETHRQTQWPARFERCKKARLNSGLRGIEVSRCACDDVGLQQLNDLTKLLVLCLQGQGGINVFRATAHSSQRFAGLDLCAVHVLAMFVVVATALVLRRIGARLADDWAGAWSGIGYVIFVHAYWPGDTLGANSEIFASLPLALSVLVFLQAQKKPASSLMFLSGALVGVATLIRQPSAVNLGVTAGVSRLWLAHCPLRLVRTCFGSR